MQLIKGTYSNSDCVFLLQDVGDHVTPVTQEEKKRLLSSGKKSYEVIPYEYSADTISERVFLRLVEQKKSYIATYVGKLSESIFARKGKNVVLVSLARGGIPVGALCKNYLEHIYNTSVSHYALSLIRNVGIDHNALLYIINQHPQSSIQFIDGWTGMGYISTQLKHYIELFNMQYHNDIDSSLGVLVDSSKICYYYGTRDDVAFPGCCLNATICGMISSIYYNPDDNYKQTFHGAIQWDESIGRDYSKFLINEISKEFKKEKPEFSPVEDNYSSKCLEQISNEFGIHNYKYIKLGIGESTRAIIRYNLKYLLVNSSYNDRISFLNDIIQEKKIKIIPYDKTDYACIAIIDDKEVC